MAMIYIRCFPVHLSTVLMCSPGMVQVRGQSGTAPQAPGSSMTWRQDIDLSGLNVMKLGIFYEALQR